MEKKLTIAVLKEMLIIVGPIKVGGWDILQKLQEGIADATIDVRSKEWLDDFKVRHKYPLELDKSETWSTTRSGMDVRLEMEEGVVLCHATVYETQWGELKGKFKTQLALPDSFLDHIHNSIRHCFTSEMSEQHERFLEEERRNWMQKRANELLGDSDYIVDKWS